MPSNIIDQADQQRAAIEHLQRIPVRTPAFTPMLGARSQARSVVMLEDPVKMDAVRRAKMFTPDLAALRTSDDARDVESILHAEALAAQLDATRLPKRPAFHPPCTLQHWQGLRPLSEDLFVKLGLALQPFTETHLCCGSAGAYSVLQPEISTALRDRKLSQLNAAKPDLVLSSNIGCIGHLQSGTEIAVRHWIEVVDAALL
jgi:Fe-S oxidoreductase